MIAIEFFTDEEIKEIILEACTEKIREVIQYDPNNIYFLCIKEGYEGIYMKKKKKDIYYTPLLDIRNVIKELSIEDQMVNVRLRDDEFFTIVMPPEDIHLTFKRFKLLYEGLERIQKKQYSQEDIEKYNLELQELIKQGKRLSFKKLFKTGEEINKPRLIILSCLTVLTGAYAVYNFIQFRKPPKLEYKMTGLELANLPYQSATNIYNKGINEQKKCESISEEKRQECLKSLESNVYYYNHSIENINYDPNTKIITFDCNPKSENSNVAKGIQIRVDNYGKNDFLPLEVSIPEVLPPEEAEVFRQRLEKYGQCSYILSGIKKAYFNTDNNSKKRVVIPVHLDFYIWFNDDFSIVYNQEEFNYQ